MILTDRYALGERIELGSHQFTEEAIIRYAERFDPQPFHTDLEAAKESIFGNLCASGWHTCAMWMRHFIDYWTAETANLTARGNQAPNLGPVPGFKALRWFMPVFAGDTISYSMSVAASRPLKSKPGRRLNTLVCEGINQDGKCVLRFELAVMETETI